MIRLRRRSVPLLAGVTLAWAAACAPIDRPDPAADAKRELARGRAYAERLVQAGAGREAPDDPATIALGYLERLRLGLGSPFRLVDQAVHDPRLPEETRRLLGWALLARTEDGDAYQPDPAPLDRASVPGVGARPGLGRYHLELIQGAVQEARDPRSGELAVRLAYTLAAAEGSVGRRAPRLAAQTAALLRDRALARQDARRLIRMAEASDTDALDLLVHWRAERRFAVEQARLGAPPLDAEREVLELAPRLAEAIRLLGPRLEGESLTPAHSPRPLLAPAAAERLAQLADSTNAPPQAPIVVALEMTRQQLLGARGLDEAETTARERFVAQAKNEERFAAEYARLVAQGGADEAGPGLARLAAATSLRTYAQETPWFPGSTGPTGRDLEERYGLVVQFDRSVPAAWRPYYRRMLATSLGDLQRVLPSLDLKGLRVRVGELPKEANALALHDPRRRVLYLPPETGAGTIAHELAHDLDWQAALRRYTIRGDYATDLALRRSGDRFGAAVAGLSTAALVPPALGERVVPNHQRRPAEVFARNVEWFVAASLAREGRMDGYLSSVQDDMLTGYGTVVPPDVTGGAGRALIAILDEVAPVYPETRAWFLKSYGPERLTTAYDLLRSVLEASAGQPAMLGGAAALALPPGGADSAQGGAPRVGAALSLAAVESARDAGFRAIDSWACAAPAAGYDRRIEADRRRLVLLAAAARARGIAARWAAHAAGVEGWRWVTRRLYGGGAPPLTSADSARARTLEPIVDAALAVGDAELPEPRDGFTLSSPGLSCGGGVFSDVRR
ncbi:MAG TPA: hypothetical protein VFQ38_24960 [Longimicrobiales bacterium]|nr:hypothetical protein [Longimicrobiales bacterium]